MPAIEYDSDQIHQVLLNLLLNALKATDHAGRISVTVKAHAKVDIVEDHQGRIDVSSAVGKGTTFTVVLPLQRKSAQPMIS